MTEKTKKPQPYVVRAYFNTEAEALAAQDKLETMSIYPDVSKSSEEYGRWKIIFVEKSLNQSAIALGAVAGVRHPGFFDPSKDWSKGFTVLTAK